MRLRSDKGATAVEFAIVLVPLLLILAGILDFGRVYSQQISITAAAREGARVMALQNNATSAKSATRTAATGLSPVLTDAQIAISPVTCTTGATVTVTITYPIQSMTGLLGPVLDGNQIHGTGVMRCSG